MLNGDILMLIFFFVNKIIFPEREAKSIGQYRIILSADTAAAARHLRCKMLDNVGLRYPHRASGAKAPRTLRPLPLLRSLFPPLAALTFAASSIICAFGLASAAPRSPYRHLELCGIVLAFKM